MEKNRTQESNRVTGQKDLIENVKKQVEGNESQEGNDIFYHLEGVMKPDFVLDDIRSQIKEVDAHLKSAPVCKVRLNRSEASGQVRGFMSEVEELMANIRVEYEQVEREEKENGVPVLLPSIHVMSKDGERSRMYFHGTPGGHEFRSFLAALYQASWQGQPLMAEILEKIKAIVTPVRLDIGVTLSCNQCPELVSGAFTIAAYSPMVETHVINIKQFPEFQKEHHIFSVPFLLVNRKISYTGRKNLEELLKIIADAIGKEL